MKFEFSSLKSPAGKIYLVADKKALYSIVFAQQWPEVKRRFPEIIENESPILRRAKKQLTEYFSGKRHAFDLPYTLRGTPFQKQVWMALAKIPFGGTKSYKEQAILIRKPQVARAIGHADGQNPLPIILPCHRVIGSNGALTGYAGGLRIKKLLLKLEGAKFI